MKIGDKVEWTEPVRKGGWVEFTQGYGEVVAISGTSATLKMKNGRKKKLPIMALHVSGSGPNQLTAALDKIFK